MTPDLVKVQTTTPFRAKPRAAAAAEHEDAILEFPVEETRAPRAPAPAAVKPAPPAAAPVRESRTAALVLIVVVIAAVAGAVGLWTLLGRATPSTAATLPAGVAAAEPAAAEPAAALTPTAPNDVPIRVEAATRTEAQSVEERGAPAGENAAESADRTDPPAVPPAPPAPGWISVKAPFVVDVFEGGRLVGSSDGQQIRLRAGSHQLEFVSEPFGFRQTARVAVPAGRGAAVALSIPKVAVNINATPWAEVLIDGTRIGDTPLANVLQPLGDHEIVFRHPQLGEKRHVARVTMTEAHRISMDMRQP